MKNFKEIAEKCLAGELSGTFKNRQGDSIPSYMLHKFDNAKYPYIYRDNCITINGYYFRSNKFSNYDIINFIPDNMQEQIKIDIPEGKVPVMEQTENGVVITWKEKELTYNEIVEILQKDFHNNYIENLLSLGGYVATMGSDSSDTNIFYKKVEVLRKLINIRNYFGKCDKTQNGYHICPNINIYDYSYDFVVRNFCIGDPHEVVFAEKEHAEQAIKMLGDELKYLFEPW